MWTLTPKWSVVHFLNLWKLGEGKDEQSAWNAKEAGNTACKANSINKTMSYSFLLKMVATTIYFFYSFNSCFLRES